MFDSLTRKAVLNMKQFTARFTSVRSLGTFVVLTSVLFAGLGNLSGCSPLQEDKHKIVVTPQYLGMTNKSVAVMVSYDAEALLYPYAPFQVSTAVSRRMKIDVTGVKTVDPQQIIDFQKRNPAWVAYTPKELLEEFKVDRLVIIDLQQYTTHERGNRHQWQGTIIGSATVYEAENPARSAYTTQVTALYPPDSTIGILDSNAETIQLGMLQRFSQKVSGRFRDHEVKE